MKKELKNYLHFYLGCDCKTKDGIMQLSSIDIDDRFPVWFKCRWDDKILSYKPQINAEILLKDTHVGRGFRYSEVKPILRLISDMTDEEGVELGIDKNLLHSFKVDKLFRQNEFMFLLSKYFDLFGLIEAGLAIDKTTINIIKELK